MCNVFDDVFAGLSDDVDAAGAGKKSSSLTEVQSFTHLKHTKGSTITGV